MQRRREAGFSFIEILVVMGIISVLVSMVVVLIPFIQEKAKRTKSTDNVRSLVLFCIGDDRGLKPWPKFNGKNLVLWIVAKGLIDKRNPKNLEILFSPGDQHYTFEAVGAKPYDDVTLPALQSEGHDDFKKLTSYAGRRNKDHGHELTASELSKGAIVFCDDDDGPLHHNKGMIIGYTDGSARFVDWSDLGISPPTDENNPEGLLGENSPSKELKHMSSGN